MLLEHAHKGRACCRVYEWDEPWVTLGRFQKPSTVFRSGARVGWSMRPTGGKAVLHGHDVTVGLAIPYAHMVESSESASSLQRSLKRVYRFAVGWLVSAMQAGGVPAMLAEDHPLASRAERGPRSADCFAWVSPNDIIHAESGAKVCGCALQLTERAVLVQASIPVRQPRVDPKEVYEEPALLHPHALDSEALVLALRDFVQRSNTA